MAIRQIINQQMGGTESSNSRQESLQKQFKHIRRYTCPCYGELTVIQNKITKQLYALKQFVSEDPTILDRIAKRKNFKHPNLINIVSYWTQVQPSLCSNLRKICILYEYFETSLEQEFTQRSNNKNPFTDEEILEFIWQLLDVINYLEEKQVKHFVNSIKAIKLNTPKKRIKILQGQQYLIYSDKNNPKFYHFHTQRKQIPPFHPNYELNVSNMNNLNIQNAFIIGIIMMQCCFGLEFNQMKIYHKGAYIFERIYEKLQELQVNYPSSYQLLKNMVKKTYPKEFNLCSFLAFMDTTVLTFKQNQVNIKQFKIFPFAKEKSSNQSKKKLNPLRTKTPQIR